MNIIKNSLLLEWCRQHVNAEQQLLAWKADIKKLEILNLNQLRDYYQVKVLGNNRVIFKIKGNDFRLITIVLVANQTVYLRWFGTHAEYDKIDPEEV
jgi:mRNA interferase HigB